MPYVLVSTQVRLESGPCTVGDEDSDPELMAFLEAKLIKQLGNNFLEWNTPLTPRLVLNRLEQKGYRVVTMTGVGQTSIWTCHKEADKILI
ncbi:hypothetical protein LSH36_8g08014 [Paralvinella palmiformis]|uniref:GTP cyclohydrolase 1 feedback regulatory protein n=1 Tax=Paralvinella palmiformis TaxID=53620 RepID=A0AAD9NJN6_9ANNE|nr:hypothetical protein LSH36_8g08014 [Paralvinella palmiformis]